MIWVDVEYGRTLHLLLAYEEYWWSPEEGVVIKHDVLYRLSISLSRGCVSKS